MDYTYLNSGVDVKKANEFSSIIKSFSKSDQIGEFAAIFEHEIFNDYYLVSTTDGIGTKILPLLERNDTKTIANDLFAMNINDLITTGAKPMFFLDYISTGSINMNLLTNIMRDLVNILDRYNTKLIGGETSELRGIVPKNSIDITGFLVGAVKKEDYIDKNNVENNDVIVGLKSSGAHANGFSLIRKLHKDGKIADELMKKALAPSRIYFDIVQKLNAEKLIKSCANITGGGIKENVLRAIPKKYDVNFDLSAINRNILFKQLAEIVGDKEAFRTFNMGIGFCVVVSKENLKRVLDLCVYYDPVLLGEVKCGVF